MKLLADEGVEAQVVERLRLDGHDVGYVAELAPGITDDDVLGRADADGRLLITLDKDFGEIVFRLGRVPAGVLLLRLSGLAPGEKAAIVSEALSEHGDQMPGAFTVITPGLMRIRPPL